MNFEVIERIPKTQRLLVTGVVFATLIGVFFLYPYRINHRKIQKIDAEVKELERQIVVNKSLAEMKDELLAKNAELQQKLLEVQQKFPNSSEITDLLKQVSVLCQQSGLDIQLWKPGSKVKSPTNLYYEIPVEVEVIGGYHDVGIFFDRVSKLPRIVNITDLSMSGETAGKGINTKCVAKTFSALSPEEIAQSQQEGKGGEGKP